MEAQTPEFNEFMKRLTECLMKGSHTAVELAQQLSLEIADVLKHLQVLRDAGIVQCEGAGAFGLYWLRLMNVTLTEGTIESGRYEPSPAQDYDLYRRSIPPEIIGCISSELAHYYGVVPVELGRTGFVVAMADDRQDLDPLRFFLNRPDLEVVRVSPEALRFALDRYYPR